MRRQWVLAGVVVACLAVVGVGAFLISNHVRASRAAAYDHYEAMSWLGLARSMSSAQDVTYEVEHFRAYAARWSLREFHTSEGEVSQLLRNGYLAEAVWWFDRACETSNAQDVTYEIRNVREYVHMAGCSLQELYISEEVISWLLRRGCLSEAIHWLEVARDSSRRPEEIRYAAERVFGLIDKAKETLDVVGTTEEELLKIIFPWRSSLVRPVRSFPPKAGYCILCQPRTIMGSDELGVHSF